MKLAWQDGYDVSAIFNKLMRLKASPERELWLPVLISAATFNPAVPENTRLSITRQCVSKLLETKGSTLDQLALELSKAQGAYLRIPQRPLLLVTSVSLSCAPAFYGRRRLADTNLTFSRTIPSRFATQLRTLKIANDLPAHPEDYLKVRVLVTARSANEASDNAFRILDALRGIWSFALGFGTLSSAAVTARDSAVNTICLGPIFSVHQPDGILAEKWLGTIGDLYTARGRPFNPVSDNRQLKKIRFFERWVKKKLRTFAAEPRSSLLLDAFARFARALDYTDEDAALVELWSLVEFLTGTKNARTDETVKRAANLFTDQRIIRSLLRHLRAHRNDIAHAGRQSILVDSLILQARFIVELLLAFHLARGQSFASFEEACQFLDLTQDDSILERQIELRRTALRFRRKGQFPRN